MKDKIKEHYKSEYNSSPYPIDDNEIDFIIKHKCECDSCGESIFEMDDFPELTIEDGELLCESCYDNEYYDVCPICEESYDTKGYEADHFVLNETAADELEMEPGIYKALEFPFYRACIISGFKNFFDNKIKLVVPIRINEHKKAKFGENCQEVESDMICSNCVEEYTKEKEDTNE